MDSDMIWFNLARDYISSQSFAFSSFTEAKYRLSHRIGLCKKYIVYDRLSLCSYEHNFSFDEYKQFGKELNLFYKPLKNDYKKCREEYKILFNYHLCNSKLKDYNITKTERPDFTLKTGEHSIGIEVTELTTQYEKVMEKISLLSEDSNSADELKTKAKARHGEKANNYHYYNFGSSPSVGTEILRPDKIREMHVQHIIEKYKNNENNILNYNDYIILCNAMEGITYTRKNEIEDVKDMLSQYSFNKPFHLAILWYENGIKCSEYQFGTI